MGDTLILERERAAQHAPGSGEAAQLEAAWLLPAAVRVQDLNIEKATQEAFARGLGSVAIGQTVETQDRKADSIIEDMERAANGDPEALERNALLVLYEGMLSKGLAEVEITRDELGELSQHGRSIHDVLESSIVHHPGNHPGLHKVTMYEALGLYSWEALDEAGYFEDHILVIPRLVPNEVPVESIREYGYFENLAVSWCILQKKAPGKFSMRSLFTAGTTVEDHEESATGKMTDSQLDAMMAARLARRHDISAVSRMYEEWGLPVPEDIIGFHRGAVISKSWFKHPQDPNADIAELYDQQLGPDYFLGDKGEKQDYVEHGRICIENLRQLEPAAKKLTKDFMDAYYGRVTVPMRATRLLAKMGRDRVVDYVIDHKEIDARPLGLAVVRERELYHQMIAEGNAPAAQALRGSIQHKARVNMCGFGEKSSKDDGTSDDNEGKKKGRENGSGDDDDNESGGGPCLIDTENCWCCPFNSDGSKRSKRLQVQALDDGKKLYCLRSGCGAWLEKPPPGSNSKPRSRMSRIAIKAASRAQSDS